MIFNNYIDQSIVQFFKSISQLLSLPLNYIALAFLFIALWFIWNLTKGFEISESSASGNIPGSNP